MRCRANAARAALCGAVPICDMLRRAMLLPALLGLGGSAPLRAMWLPACPPLGRELNKPAVTANYEPCFGIGVHSALCMVMQRTELP